jgi:chitodextrinase
MTYNFLSFRVIIFAFFIFSIVCDRALSETVIHVDNQNPSASDSNPGTDTAPLKTLKKAVQLAEVSNKQNIPVTVFVHAGTYRESIALNASSTSKPAAMVFQAVPLNSAIVSGSDVWTGWQRQSNTNIYTHDWPYNWGGTYRGTTTPQIVGRREMVFVNGTSLKQVLSLTNLTNNSFFVDEAADKIYISTGTNVTSAKVEVAIRPGLFVVNSRTNITIKGFVFQHDTSWGDLSAVRMDKVSNILIEDTDFLWNGWGGLRINAFDNVTVRRTVANHNGGRGTEMVRGTNLLMEDNETSYNNWRGFSGGYTGHNVAGAKHLRVHGAVYKNHISLDNKARGFWLDFDSKDIVFDGLILKDNLEAGISLEANQGPIVIKNSVVCNNTTFGGIISANSENVSVIDSVIYNNTNTQFRLSGVEKSRPVTDWETGQQYNLFAQKWTIQGNIIGGTTSKHFLINVEDSPADQFLNTLTANNNIYWNPVIVKAFRADGDTDFNGWKAKTRQENNSVFADPGTAKITDKQREHLEICMNQGVSIFTVIVSAVTSDSAEMAWTTDEATDSRVEYGLTELYGSKSAIDQALVIHHRVLLTGLSPETTYHFRVMSKDQSGNAYVSNDYTLTTPIFTDISPPTTPSVLTAIVISGSQINLSWGVSTDNVGVKGYRIYRDGSAIITTTQSFYSDTGLANSTKFAYTVTAFDAAGNESEHSKEAYATTYVDPSSSPPSAPAISK